MWPDLHQRMSLQKQSRTRNTSLEILGNAFMAIFIALRQSYKEMPYILAFENPPVPLPLSERFVDGFSNVGHMDVTWITRGFFFHSSSVFFAQIFSNTLRSSILNFPDFEQTLFKSIFQFFERGISPSKYGVTRYNCKL